jgi:hypothetical protein
VDLEGLESENHKEEVRKGVPMEEEDLREKPHSPLGSPVVKERSLERRSGG